MNAYVTTVNGWTTIFGCGEHGNGMLFKAECANKLPAVNVPQEAVYWTTSVVDIKTALRISDLLELQVRHFLDDQQHIKRQFWIKEQKRG